MMIKKTAWWPMLLLALAACQRADEVPLDTLPVERKRMIVQATDIPEVTTTLLSRLGSRSEERLFSVNAGEASYPFFIDWERIKQLVEPDGREVYTFGLAVTDGNPATFYNLVLKYNQNHEAHQPYILKYKMSDSFLAQYQATGSLVGFEGTVQKILINAPSVGIDRRGNAFLDPDGETPIGEPCSEETPLNDGPTPGSGNSGDPDPGSDNGASYQCTTYLITTTWYTQVCAGGSCTETVASIEYSYETECGWSSGSEAAGLETGCEPEEGEIPIVEPEEPCDTGDEILDNEGIQDKMENLWTNSQADGPMNSRLENGGWIINDGQGGISFQEIGPDWSKTPCGLDPPQNILANIPENAIGFIHTHPFYKGEDRRNVCGDGVRKKYKSGYSIDDLDFVATVASRLGDFGFAGYVMDGNRITRFNSLGSFQLKQYKRCSY